MVGHLRHSRHFTFRVQDGDQRRQLPADWPLPTARPTPPFFSFLWSGLPFRARELKAALWVRAAQCFLWLWVVSPPSLSSLSRTHTLSLSRAAHHTEVKSSMPCHATPRHSTPFLTMKSC